MITGDQKSKIDQIWNTFWTGGVTNTITIVEQLTYLIFIRDLDEIETRNERKAQKIKTFKHQPVFSEEQQQFRWKNLKEMDVDKRHSIFSSTEEGKGIFPFIRNLGSEKSLFSQYMNGASFGISKPSVLDTVMEQLNGLDMTDQDTKGDIYEYLLSKLEGGGTAGQFRTPRHIIKMMVEMMQPNLKDQICDPSCGSAGFLVAAKEYIDRNYPVTELATDTNKEHINKKMFNGMEFDATMLRIASMNLYLHGVQEPNIMDVDAVSGDNKVSDQYTLILANPPFKGTIDKNAIATSLTNVCATAKTELLFLALMLRQLKDGGRCAVIVPDGVLFGSSKAHKSIRKEITENHKLDAVISMPSGVFKPYAGVSTAILVFTKTGTGGTDKVWFYDMKEDGKTLDDKRTLKVDEEIFSNPTSVFEKSEDQQAEIHKNTNIPDIIKRWNSISHPSGGDAEGRGDKEAKRKRTAQSFFVPLQEIIDNDWDLSINRYKEIIYEEIKYDAPKDIITNIQTLDSERNKLFKELEELLR